MRRAGERVVRNASGLAVALCSALALAFPGSAAAIGDVLPPDSSARPPAFANSNTFTIPYTAADDPGGSGVARVDLYAQAPGESTYTDVATVTPDVPAFTYTATAGDGQYSFYTVATDNAGNVELPPLVGANDGSTQLDTVAPDSSAGPATLGGDGSITVPFSATDVGTGVAAVELWALPPGAGSYALAATQPGGSSPFTYTPTAGAGDYSFYTVAVDQAGNREAPAATPDTTVALPAPPGPTPTPTPTPGPAPAPTPTANGTPAAAPAPQDPVAQLPAAAPTAPAPAPQLPLVAALTLPGGQTLRTLLAHGLVLKLYAYRAVNLQVDLLLSRTTARRIGLGRHVVVARRDFAAQQPNIYAVKLVPNALARARLRKLRKISLTLQTTLRAASGRSIAKNPLKLTR